MATKPLPGIAPVSSENLQFVIPVDNVGEPPLVAPVSQENMQFVMPEVREPSMYEMTRDFDEFKSYYKAGAFDSDVEGVGDICGHSMGRRQGHSVRRRLMARHSADPANAEFYRRQVRVQPEG